MNSLPERAVPVVCLSGRRSAPAMVSEEISEPGFVSRLETAGVGAGSGISWSAR